MSFTTMLEEGLFGVFQVFGGAPFFGLFSGLFSELHASLAVISLNISFYVKLFTLTINRRSMIQERKTERQKRARERGRAKRVREGNRESEREERERESERKRM